MLWPDADPDAAVNSLNQTVFQLRRYIDPNYRGGESVEYVLSNADSVGLNENLIHTDVDEIRRLPTRLASTDWQQRQAYARRSASLVRGEFLSDFRYEDWVNRQQLKVHGEVRETLIGVARKAGSAFDAEVSAQAAAALLTLDAFDESATIALADALSQSGRRAAARQVVIDFMNRIEAELEMSPSPDFHAAAARLGSVNSPLTSGEAS
jgi:DNA-binding SARP family transcriptional activator